MSNNVDNKLILNKILKYKNFKSKAELARFLGVSPQNLATWYSRNTINLNKVTEAAPEISTSWLLTGEGSMLKSNLTDQLQSKRKPSTATRNRRAARLASRKRLTGSVSLAEMMEIQAGYQEMLKTSQSQINKLIELLNKK